MLLVQLDIELGALVQLRVCLFCIKIYIFFKFKIIFKGKKFTKKNFTGKSIHT